MKSRKFNWVDILFVVLIIIAVVLVFQRDRLFGDDGAIQIATGKTQLIYTTKASSVPLEVVEAFKVGDKPLARGELQNGEITEITYKPSTLFELKDGEVVKTEDPQYYDLYVTFKAEANRYASYMDMGSQEIKVGVPFYLKTPDAISKGIIVSVEEVE